MKILFPAVILFVIISAHGQTIRTIKNSEIHNVRVYQSGAQVSRTVQTAVEAGITQLLLPDLSSEINKSSITVSGTGDATLLSVVHQLNYIDEEKRSPEIMRIQDSLDQTSLDIEKNTGLGNVYTQEAALLSANKSVGGANSGVDPDNLKEVADIFRERMIDLTIKLIDIHKEEKRLAEKFKKLNAQLIELKSKDNKPTSNILITLSAKARTNVNFTVSYYVSGASWTPKYDIRATDIQSPVQLFYKADITQNTGEDWKDVKLILSTGNPSLGGNKPVLLPWYLDFYNSGSQWQKPMNLTNQAPAVMELQSVEIRSGKQEETDLQYNTVSVEQNQLSTDFEIQIPYSVPSDSKQYTVDIQSHELPASFTYYAAPKIDKDAFLMARITGWENLNLLAGKTNVYFEGSFVGESSVDPRSANDTLDLSLGRDKTIIILREKQKDLNSSKFVGGNIVKELNYEITVRNGKKQPIQITLEDQVPVTRNSDIKINVQEYSSGNYSEDNGKITWKLNIAPAGVEKRKLNFTVKYPKDKVISGL